MARRPFSVEISTKPDPFIQLCKDILAKHTADGAASPIPVALAADLAAKMAEAEAQGTLQSDLEKIKEERTEARNQRLGLLPTQSSTTEGTVLFLVTSIIKFLLGQFRGSERKLGDWGYTVNSPKGKVQVVLPRTAEKLLKLGKDILEKHNDDEGDSILSVFDMAALQTLVTEADTLNAQASKASRDKEKATQARNIALGIAKGQNTKTLGTAAHAVRAIRDILLGIYRGREQSLGDWGFEVNFTTPPPPPAG